MGAVGIMELVTRSIEPDSIDTVTDGDGTGDDFTYNVDLTSATSFTLTGDFDMLSAAEASYNFSWLFTQIGTFNINNAGEFTYTVTRTQVEDSGLLQARINVGGQDASGGPEADDLIFNFTVCFAAGTGIATPGGETAVEALKIGELVTTADGRSVPVKWIGRTTISPMFNPADRLEPVRIARGALGPEVPNRDLIVTADHGMIIDGLVINAGALVGGRGIEWYPWKAIGQSLIYYHVETNNHEVIFANMAPAETYLDSVGRQSFDNFAEYRKLYDHEPVIPEMPRPRISASRLLPQSVRDRLGIENGNEPVFDWASLARA